MDDAFQQGYAAYYGGAGPIAPNHWPENERWAFDLGWRWHEHEHRFAIQVKK